MTDTATMAGLDTATLGDMLRVAGSTGFDRWQDQIKRTGGCSDPIHLTGWSITKDRATGETLRHYSTDTEPGGRLRIACGNRRASRCPSCAWMYAGDTYHLIRAGLVGDSRHGIPAAIRNRPRVFATFTAPSFGPVHNQPSRGTCRCGTAHRDDDPALGTPLDPATYDYAGAVLFNNHASDLWHRFVNRLRREIAAHVGITQREFKEVARLSYGKVAEFQKRGGIHFHAVIRLDGPDGPDTAPPSWASTELLTRAIQAAAVHPYVTVNVPPAPDAGHRNGWRLRWGQQLDVRPITAFGDGKEIKEQAVASYVAKYATKAAENTGTVDRRIGNREAALLLGLPDHPRRLIEACFDLDPFYPERRLSAWAHMLGFRGHFSSKSRAYSTTLGVLRQIRADYRAAQEREALGLDGREPDSVLVLASWEYAGHGHTPGESALAASIARNLQLNRETAREALQDQRASEGAAA
ncbi:replication initiation protein [Streptomyces sp. NBC_00006]|uniref:replication initiator protein RepSA n=1 Tax=Streptomyces sp. NBC_00006 TaxID=2975619 RepID=UPI00224F5500|nr:replication initiator protein RepSA [Streptomyces sp. NBC_00006]MCX5533574.1 replication initiation protein [Streptomyces sp. NBC_00006]